MLSEQDKELRESLVSIIGATLLETSALYYGMYIQLELSKGTPVIQIEEALRLSFDEDLSPSSRKISNLGAIARDILDITGLEVDMLTLYAETKSIFVSVLNSERLQGFAEAVNGYHTGND